MNVVPKNLVDRIEFYEGHMEPWGDHAVEIGTSPAEVADLASKTAAAREAYAQQQTAQSAARAATLRLKLAVDDMAGAGASIILQIRARAGGDGDGVYSLASIGPPAKRSPKGEPGRPDRLAWGLGQEGALTLTWKCRNPRGSKGTIYQVWRRMDGGPLEYLGQSGTKRFVDATVPQGTARITYQIQAVRSTAVGPWAMFNVNFGVRGGTGIAPMLKAA